MPSIHTNECFLFSVTKYAKSNPTQAITTITTTNKKKYTVLASILSGAGLNAFSVFHYTSSSGGHGDILTIIYYTGCRETVKFN